MSLPLAHSHQSLLLFYHLRIVESHYICKYVLVKWLSSESTIDLHGPEKLIAKTVMTKTLSVTPLIQRELQLVS